MLFPFKTVTRRRILSFLLHPGFISLVTTVLIIFLFVSPAKKYKMQLEDRIMLNKIIALHYDDLDGNGYSDRIWVSDYVGENNIVSLLIRYYPSSSFNEWDFKGSCSFAYPRFLYTGDFDHDGKKEVYLFTMRNDSIFLNIIFDPKSKSSKITSRFITSYKPWNGKPNVSVFDIKLEDMNRDSYKDLVFIINSGFSLEPRSTFIYDIRNDSLTVSPKKGFMTTGQEIMDINNDGYPEILTTGYASQNVNIKDTGVIPLHDNCCWQIVYDHRLQYLFPPRKFPYIGYSAIYTTACKDRKGEIRLFTLYYPPESSGKPPVIYRFNPYGAVIKSDSFPEANFSTAGALLPVKKGSLHFLSMMTSDQDLYTFDEEMHLISKEHFKPGMLSAPDSLDIDSDGEKEFVFLDAQRTLLSVFRREMSDPVTLKLPDEYFWMPHFSVLKRPGNSPLLVLFNGSKEFRISYSMNPFYYTQWLAYLAIFMSIFLFSLMIRKIYGIQIIRRQQAEKKISELQMALVRNQMDPHFIMNVINSVIFAVDRQEKEQVTSKLMLFSKMYRSLLLSADKITRPLKEELEFTENYLALERFRFNNRFDYRIAVAPEVNTGWEIPKMIIQSPVENAVKHGLSTVTSGGRIEVFVSLEKKDLFMVIRDNGIGRHKAKSERSGSTGKGIALTMQFVDLYYKISGKRITWDIQDIYDPEGKPDGTRVVIRMPAE